MALEIERKFLLEPGNNSWRSQSVRRVSIIQGHFLSTSETAIRVRICDWSLARLTIKGAMTSCTRPEFEYDIPVSEAQMMLELFCQGRVINKTRYYIPAAEEGLVWEIDEYHGALEGHYNAELEIPNESFRFQLPNWVGREVTGMPQYSNAALARSQKWPEE